MARKRPIGFIIMAIVNFVVAAFFIACGVCANYSDSGQTWFVEINKDRWDQKKLHEHLKAKAPAYTPVKITGIVLGYCICVGLVLSGVAMLFGGLLAKIFTLLVYAGGFVHHVVMTIYQLVWVHPAMNQFFDQMPAAIIVGRGPAEIARAASLFPGYVWIAWWVIGCFFYLIAAAVVLLCPTSSDDDEEEDSRKSKRSKRRRDESENDEDEDEVKPVSKKSKRPRDDDDERPSSKESKRRRDDDEDDDDEDDRKRSRRRRS